MVEGLLDALSQWGLIVPNLPRLAAWALFGAAAYNALFAIVETWGRTYQARPERKLYRWGLTWAIIAAVAAWFLLPKSFMVILEGGVL